MLCLVAALPAEARPLADHFGLKALDGHPYRLYGGEHIRLAVSGVGKVAAAAAVAYLRALRGGGPTAWLNAGIAGHASAAVGTALLAHKVVDAASGKSFYPVFTAAPPRPTDTLRTVDQPESIYADQGAYDMEASGFCETALRFASAELVHCLKIVSDNPQSSWRALNAKKISELIAAQLDTIDNTSRELIDLARDLAAVQADPPYLADLLARWPFTATQRHQLRDLLMRWQTLAPEQAIFDELVPLRNRDDVLEYINKRLQHIDFTLQG